MQSRSDTWKDIVSAGNFLVETKAVISGTEYTTASAPVLDCGLFQGSPSVGNCSSAAVTFSIVTDDDIPKSSEIGLKMRVKSEDGEDVSEWLPVGVFYISRRQIDYITSRETDDASTTVTLQCYDAMLKARADYFPSGSGVAAEWPKPMATVATAIASRLGTSLDSRTRIPTGSLYYVEMPTGKTVLEVLSEIAIVCGGNWIITPAGALRLVPLNLHADTTPIEVLLDTDETAQLVSVETDSSTIGTDDQMWLMSGEFLRLVDEESDEIAEVEAVLGKLNTGREMTITRVVMTETDEDGTTTTYTSGASGGYEITIADSGHASQAMCDTLYTALADAVYLPYTMGNAIYDPAAELGDTIQYGEHLTAVLTVQHATIGSTFVATASSPVDDGDEDEYPYQSGSARTTESIWKGISEARKTASSFITQDDTGIMVSNNDSGYTPSTAPSGLKNTFIGESQMSIRDGTTDLAKFGEENGSTLARIGLEAEEHIDVGEGALTICDGTHELASFGEEVVIGNLDETGAAISLTDNSFTFYSSANTTITHIYSANDKDGLATSRVASSTAYSTGYIYVFDDVEEVLECYYSDTLEDITPLPTVDANDATKIVLDTDVTYREASITVRYSTKAELYRVTLGTRLSSSHSDYTGTGTRSISIGNANSVYGRESVGIGTRNTTGANYNFVFGAKLKGGTSNGGSSDWNSQIVVGRYNEQKSINDTAFIVGTGTGQSDRKNGLEITTDDDLLIELDTNAASTTTDYALYTAITALGWESDVIES